MKLYCKGLLSLTAVTFLLASCGSETKDEAATNVTVNKEDQDKGAEPPVQGIVETAKPPVVTLFDPNSGPVPGFSAGGGGGSSDSSVTSHHEEDERDWDRDCECEEQRCRKPGCNQRSDQANPQNNDQDSNQTNNNNQTNNQNLVNNIVVNVPNNNNNMCSDYSATVTGTCTSTSISAPPANTVTGTFEVGFPIPLDLARVACVGVSGFVGTRATFITGETAPGCLVPDFNNPLCPRQSSQTASVTECLVVDASPLGLKAYFSGTVVNLTPDPRSSDVVNAQALLEASQGRLVQFASLTDPNVGPDTRSLFTTAILSLIEGVDNAIIDPTFPGGEIGQINPLVSCSNPPLTTKNLCTLRDQLLSQNSYYTVVCNPGAPVCVATGQPSCNLPTPNPDGVGFVPNGQFQCYIANTSIQFLAPDGSTPIGAPVPNTVANLCNPPAGTNFSLAAISRTCTSGDIEITRNPAL